MGLILLEPIVEFSRRVPLTELRANGVDFHRSLQQGRGVAGPDVTTIITLARS